MSDKQMGGVRLRLPATSANLGPGFDAVGLALTMYLTVEAWPAKVWSIEATGRDAEIIGSVDDNLMIKAYEATSGPVSEAPPLRLKIHNEIPLGMGCGSSAAAICAGVALAGHFEGLKFSPAWIATEAAEIEGHPDNVAACCYGGFTVSAMSNDGGPECEMLEGVATFAGDPSWQMMLAMPREGLATKQARALLPESYAKADAVFNVQRVALLTAAFAQGRLDLLRAAMQDRMHQPYREQACPLLGKLLPLADEPEIAGVALSGAGPSVLVVLAKETTLLEAETRLRAAVGEDVELVPVRVAEGASKVLL